MKYNEFNKMWQDKFSALPVKFAFGDKQFEAMMASWGLTTSDEDLKKVCGIICGACCLWPGRSTRLNTWMTDG